MKLKLLVAAFAFVIGTLLAFDELRVRLLNLEDEFEILQSDLGVTDVWNRLYDYEKRIDTVEHGRFVKADQATEGSNK